MPLPRALLLDILSSRSPWGRARLRPGFLRSVTARLLPFLDSPEIVALIGPRRAGKTTVLFQVMAALAERGVAEGSMLHVNFEEPAFAPELGTDLLDQLYRVYRTEVQPAGRAWLFLDEIQLVPGWERWVRARSETEDIKIFVTGSSAALMSRELATLLTGRHATFTVLPLDFAEFLRFRQIAVPKRPSLAGSPPEIENALLAYLRWGGFPEVVLAEDDERKAILLKQYFDDVLFKDVAMRHQVRDLAMLRSLAVHLLTQTASLVSLKRLAGIFKVSLDLARTYCGYLEEAFLVSFAELYSLKTAERLRHPKKVHAVDTGLRNAVAMSAAPDRGRLAESAVFGSLARQSHDGLYYWQGHGEIDIAVRRGNEITELVQVTYDLEDEEVQQREFAALAEAKQSWPKAKARLVVSRAADTAEAPEDSGVEIVALWQFLLDL